MIGFLNGTLVEKDPQRLLIEVQGVGYEVETPMSTFLALPPAGSTLRLRIHQVLREDASLLFAGDHVLSTITPSIGFEPAYVQQPLRDYLASLAKVRALPDMKLLPAHGPVTDSSHTRIDELVAFHDVRLDRSLAAVESGAGTAMEVAAELPWTRRERRLPELNPFDAVLACFETLAHLELLALQARVRRIDGDTVRFAPLDGLPPAATT